MNNKGNNNIPSMKGDDEILALATRKAYEAIREKYIFDIPDTWNIECGKCALSFDDIREKMIDAGYSISKANTYYGEDSSIKSDSYIIWLNIYRNERTIKNPIFIGEMKKQGTNNKRLEEGKKKQAQGNAAGDRTAKNFHIAADFCYLCDRHFFPYNVFMHGYDFKETEITKTTKAKLMPFFGKLNVLNPYFDADIPWTRKGGSCFYQGDDYTYEQLYKVCYDCCEAGIKYYLSKYKEK